VQRVIGYVDGLNLYHGVRAKFGRRYLWLDIERLVRSILLPGQHLVAVRYFTARVRNQPDSESRQVNYLNALAASCPRLTIIEGRFQERDVVCRRCGTVRITYDEKETDVNLAAAIVGDAACDRFDMSLLVSADADLTPAIRMARTMTSGKRFVAAFPPSRRSYALQHVSSAVTFLGHTNIRRAQLPDQIALPDGIVLERPDYWR
jgi:uncharacterized LabA/DUF88 family protein